MYVWCTLRDFFNLNPELVNVGEILRNRRGWGIKLALPKAYTQPSFALYDKIQVLHMLHLNLISNTCLSLLVHITGGKRVYGPGSFGPLVPVAEPGSITRDQCRSRFQHEPGPIGLHVDVLQGRSPWVNGPGS
jgi:hypothetical protein